MLEVSGEKDRSTLWVGECRRVTETGSEGGVERDLDGGVDRSNSDPVRSLRLQVSLVRSGGNPDVDGYSSTDLV